MSKRNILGAAMGIAALFSFPIASEAHCLKHFGSDVSGVVDGTTSFAKRVVDRTDKLGTRMFGWLKCDKWL